MKKQIAWEKWHNPYGDDEDTLKNFPFSKDESSESEFPFSKYEDTDQMEMPKPYFSISEPQSIRVMSTPMGMVPLTEHTDIGKIFNFWMGHTNFDISSNIIELINSISGVETLDVFTRYRFRIGIAKHPDFQEGNVLRNIDKAIQSI